MLSCISVEHQVWRVGQAHGYTVGIDRLLDRCRCIHRKQHHGSTTTEVTAFTNPQIRLLHLGVLILSHQWMPAFSESHLSRHFLTIDGDSVCLYVHLLDAVCTLGRSIDMCAEHLLAALVEDEETIVHLALESVPALRTRIIPYAILPREVIDSALRMMLQNGLRTISI